MHLYLGAIGLKSIISHKKLEHLIKKIIKECIENDNIVIATKNVSGDGLYQAQIKYYFNKLYGLSINGFYNGKTKKFSMDHYYPFLDSSTKSFESEIIISRKTDKEAYNVLCDEPGRGIALIFHLTNPVDYIESETPKGEFHDKAVRLAAMSNDGSILLPVKKSECQIKKCQAAIAAKNKLIKMAKQGDQAAMDNLTIDEIDTYTDIYKRMRKEDVLTIVDTSFMPSGFECDSYSVIGNIIETKLCSNNLTGEEVYILTLECNDIMLDLCINKEDVIGIPEYGRRFKGNIWLQGQVELVG